MVYIGGLSGSSGGLTGSKRVGAYHTTNKLLFHVGPVLYKLLGGFSMYYVFFTYSTYEYKLSTVFEAKIID